MIGADRFIENLDNKDQAKHATQRYGHGISDLDMWNFDSFLADVIVSGCNWYIENAMGSPWHLEWHEWRQILTKIRDGFSIRDERNLPKPSEEAWELLRKYFSDLWD